MIRFDEVEKFWEDSAVAYSNVLFRYSSEGPEEYHKDLSETYRCPGRDSNRPALEYKSKRHPFGLTSSIRRRGRSRSIIMRGKKTEGTGRNKFNALCHLAFLSGGNK
jgi:hypothetical protein